MATLKIKAARISKIENNKYLKAFADISLNNSLIIRNLRVIEGDKGPFVSMPQELSKKDGKWYDTIRCLNKETREEITDKVLAAYNKA